MDVDQLDLNPRIVAAVKKAKLQSAREVLRLSGPDLQRLTGLSGIDARRVLQAASLGLRGSGVFTGCTPGLQCPLKPAQPRPRRRQQRVRLSECHPPAPLYTSPRPPSHPPSGDPQGLFPAAPPGTGEPHFSEEHPVVQCVRVSGESSSRAGPALQLYQQRARFPVQHQRLSLGCPVLDRLLRGGLPLDGITELAGCSSAGKTQLALQLCLAVQLPQQHGGLEAGAVYICTEDVFPDRRLQQLITHQPRLRAGVPGELLSKVRFGDQIFIEHAADVDTLLECVSRRVPILLARGMARLVVLDSVAAPFRCEFDSQALTARARHLQTLGAALRHLSCSFQSPVLCINQVHPHPSPLGSLAGQSWGRHVLCHGLSGSGAWLIFQVTEVAEEQRPAGPQGFSDERVSPALGTAWSNQLLMRLTAERARGKEEPARTLRVVFAPHLPPTSCLYTIGAEGVQGMPGTESC
ncbi:DNA repair protein XRCC3 isoform X2 [Loxodonta africana]|uniref:DNA repair protein XRCC3 isoform X2 n=1 Tax=Loxodonta africana TaxID=9785 RepID=UPI0030D0F0F9